MRLAVGNWSYSLYLWHWPIIVIGGYLITDGARALAVTEGLGLVALSFIPSILSYVYVEEVARKSTFLTSSTSNSLMLAFSGIALCLAVGMVLSLSGTRPSTSNYIAQYEVAGASSMPFGAQVLRDRPAEDPAGQPVDQVASIVPKPEDARASSLGCDSPLDSSEVKTCTFGDKTSDRMIVVLGDSHAGQFVPALARIALTNGWKVVTYTKELCAYADVPQARSGSAGESQECTTWNDDVAARLAADPAPALVVASSIDRQVLVGGSLAGGDASSSALGSGIARAWQPLVDRGVPIIGIGATPWPGIDVPECVSANEGTLTRCAVPREEALTNAGPSIRLATEATGSTYLDLFDAICPTERCAPVIGGTLVYRDTNHITARYSQSLAPRIEPVVQAVMG